MKKQLLFCMLLIAGILSCSHSVNPYLDRTDSGIQLSDSALVSGDTILADTTYTLSISITLKEHVDSLTFSVIRGAEHFDTTVRIAAASNPQPFHFSVQDSGTVLISITAFINDGTTRNISLDLIAKINPNAIDLHAPVISWLNIEPINDSLSAATLPQMIQVRVIDEFGSAIDSLSVNGHSFDETNWGNQTHSSLTAAIRIDSLDFGKDSIIPLVIYARDTVGNATTRTLRLHHHFVSVDTTADTTTKTYRPRLTRTTPLLSLSTTDSVGVIIAAAGFDLDPDSGYTVAFLVDTVLIDDSVISSENISASFAYTMPSDTLIAQLRLSCGTLLIDSLFDTIIHVIPIDTTHPANPPRLVRVQPTASLTTTSDNAVSITVLAADVPADSVYAVAIGVGPTALDTVDVSAANYHLATFSLILSTDTTIAWTRLFNADTVFDSLCDTIVKKSTVVVDSGIPTIVSVQTNNGALPAITADSLLPLSIVAADERDSIVAVSVNGSAATQSGSFLWTNTVALRHSIVGDTLVVTATNSKGKSTSDTFVVIFNTKPRFVKTPASRSINTYYTVTDTVGVFDDDMDWHGVIGTATVNGHTDTLNLSSTSTVDSLNSGNVLYAYTWVPSAPQNSGVVVFRFVSTDSIETIDTTITCPLLYINPDYVTITTPPAAFPDSMNFNADAVDLTLTAGGTVTPPYSWTAHVLTNGKTYDILANDSTSGAILWEPDPFDTGTAVITAVVSGKKSGITYFDTLTKAIYVRPLIVNWKTDSSYQTTASIPYGVLFNRAYYTEATIGVAINTALSTAREDYDYSFTYGTDVTFAAGDTLSTITVQKLRSGKKLVLDITSVERGMAIGPPSRKIIQF